MEPRGVRNHNPLNIERRPGTKWLGQTKEQTDPRFVQFQSDVLGFRAALIIIRRYIKQYDLKTIRKIISRWAPPGENHTEIYIQVVAERSGIDARRIVSWEEKEKMVAIVKSMAFMETGVLYPAAIIEKAYDLCVYSSLP